MIEFLFISVFLTIFVLGFFGLALMMVHATTTASTQINATLVFDDQVDQDTVLLASNQINELYLQLDAAELYSEEQLILSPNQYRAAVQNHGVVHELNRMMLTLYFYDIDRSVYRYPGTVVTKTPDAGAPFDTILVPIFDTATQSITEWKRPLEIDDIDDSNPDPDAPALVTFSVWMPSQQSSISSVTFDEDGIPFGDNQPIGVNGVQAFADAGLSEYSLSGTSYTSDGRFGTVVSDANRGIYGLGELTLAPREVGDVPIVVRPYRRIFTRAGSFRLKP
ncbi:MAG: hypothetical protein AAF958_07815 [Planctomycetota bacterium]